LEGMLRNNVREPVGCVQSKSKKEEPGREEEILGSRYRKKRTRSQGYRGKKKKRETLQGIKDEHEAPASRKDLRKRSEDRPISLIVARSSDTHHD